MTNEERQALWDSYFETHDHDIKNQLITEYVFLVKIIANKLFVYFEDNVEYDDLVGYGIFGLIDAIDRFDRTIDVKFETYASLRIKGEILDQMRKMDWIPRNVKEKQRKVNQAKKILIDKGIFHPSAKEIASELGISEDEYYSWEVSFIPTMLDRMDEPINEDGGVSKKEFLQQQVYELPEDKAVQEDIKAKLYEAIDSLSERDRQLIYMYYFENLTNKEIGAIFGVTEVRVFQLHKRALARMKEHLNKYAGILFI